MSTTTNSGTPHSTFSEPAEVRLVRRPRSRSKYQRAYLLVSSRICWKVANEDGTNKPQSLVDFRNAESIILSRLSEGTWSDVDDLIKVDSHNGKPRITVCGCVHGRKLRRFALLARHARIEIIPSTSEQHEIWVNQIRARIVPWNLLQQEIKDLAIRAPSYGVKELANALGGLVTGHVDTKPSSMLIDNVQQNLNTLSENVGHVAETARLNAELSKIVFGVSSAFYLVALSAQGVVMCVQATRGRRVLPIALHRVVVLLRYVLESITEIMKHSRSVTQLDKEFVFNVLKETVCTIDLAETQLLRGPLGQIMNAEDVQRVEKKIADLEARVVIANNISRTFVDSEEMNRPQEEQEIWVDGLDYARPSLSPFFSGRKRELAILKDMLKNQGRAVIAQYDGVGKKELMTAFAYQADRDKLVPGGVFWVPVDGGEKDVIDSLAGLAEKLLRRKMKDEERQNRNFVLAALKQGLDERKGRWLLCMDNADESKVSRILNEVLRMTEGTRTKGWLVVTSPQNGPEIWSELRSEQKMVLEPLCREDAMVALWRRVRKIETSDADDDTVMNSIRELERDDSEEYLALRELCGDADTCGLRRLPLALVHAGTYMARFDFSFSKYRNLYKNTNRMEHIEVGASTREEVNPILKLQRSIRVTWKINMSQLSAQTYAVLRAIAMLGLTSVGEAVMKGIVKIIVKEAIGDEGQDEPDEGSTVEGTFEKIVIEELVNGSSLIRRVGERERQEGSLFRMHGLVRRFVLGDMERGSAIWNEVYNVALVTVHAGVETELRNEGRSFEELPEIFGSNHRDFATHARALVEHHTLPVLGDEIRHASEVEDIFRYSGNVMVHLGKAEEEIQVWKRLLAILHYQEVNRGYVERLFDMLYRRNRGKDLKSRMADVYNSLGLTLMTTGNLHDAASKLEQSLEMKLAIHGHDKVHSDIAALLGNVGLVYQELSQLDKALENYQQSLEMELTIHGHDELHPDIAASFNNLGSVCQRLGKLNKALEKYEQGYEMYLAIHRHEKHHPAIATSLSNLGSVYQELGELDKALEKYGQSLDMYRAIHGHEYAHPSIAITLSNVGSLYQKLGDLDRSLEKHEQSLKMYQAIHGLKQPHSDTAISLWNIGIVHHEQKSLIQAAKYLEKSLEMLRILHAPTSLHPDIKVLLRDLANVYEDQGKRDEAVALRIRITETVRTSDGERSRPANGLLNILYSLFQYLHSWGNQH